MSEECLERDRGKTKGRVKRRRKRRSSAPSAMDIVRQSVIDKYGPKSIL